MTWVTHVHTVTRVTSDNVCAAFKPICYLDAHPSVGPVLTVAAALVIAASGWIREGRRNRAEREAFASVAIMVTWRALKALGALRRHARMNEAFPSRKAADSIKRQSALADLDRILEAPLQNWPSARLYLSAHAVRTEAQRLIAATDDTEASFILADTERMLAKAEAAFDRSAGQHGNRRTDSRAQKALVATRDRLQRTFGGVGGKRSGTG